MLFCDELDADANFFSPNYSTRCKRERSYDTLGFIYQATFNAVTTATWKAQVENVTVALKNDFSDRE